MRCRNEKEFYYRIYGFRKYKPYKMHWAPIDRPIHKIDDRALLQLRISYMIKPTFETEIGSDEIVGHHVPQTMNRL